MLKSILFVTCCLGLGVSNSSCAGTAPTRTEQQLTAEGLALVKQFAGRLKPLLKQSLEQGGPVTAVQVCASAAPLIAKQLSEESGWQIKRVSLQARNPQAKPDTWERQAMRDILADRTTAKAEILRTKNTENDFRLLKPQYVESMCLQCHGSAEQISTATQAVLQQYYPQDSATAYQLGDMRGAFSLRYSLH